ncbi:hypothetical protein Nepgr_019485 [Nepenthes gracilis]|uniref:Uncharacterized protein n=1 Tax=Nepenthes gracilis TaxID=150966 RepID=A0AAD3SVY4_NEPGR|nr:hypothetical protein Nepgr_019485 [Nepenthes gracilis]
MFDGRRTKGITSDGYSEVVGTQPGPQPSSSSHFPTTDTCQSGSVRFTKSRFASSSFQTSDGNQPARALTGHTRGNVVPSEDRAVIYYGRTHKRLKSGAALTPSDQKSAFSSIIGPSNKGSFAVHCDSAQRHHRREQQKADARP